MFPTSDENVSRMSSSRPIIVKPPRTKRNNQSETKHIDKALESSQRQTLDPLSFPEKEHTLKSIILTDKEYEEVDTQTNNLTPNMCDNTTQTDCLLFSDCKDTQTGWNEWEICQSTQTQLSIFQSVDAATDLIPLPKVTSTLTQTDTNKNIKTSEIQATVLCCDQITQVCSFSLFESVGIQTDSEFLQNAETQTDILLENPFPKVESFAKTCNSQNNMSEISDNSHILCKHCNMLLEEINLTDQKSDKNQSGTTVAVQTENLNVIEVTPKVPDIASSLFQNKMHSMRQVQFSLSTVFPPGALLTGGSPMALLMAPLGNNLGCIK